MSIGSCLIKVARAGPKSLFGADTANPCRSGAGAAVPARFDGVRRLLPANALGSGYPGEGTTPNRNLRSALVAPDSWREIPIAPISARGCEGLLLPLIWLGPGGGPFSEAADSPRQSGSPDPSAFVVTYMGSDALLRASRRGSACRAAQSMSSLSSAQRCKIFEQVSTANPRRIRNTKQSREIGVSRNSRRSSKGRCAGGSCD